MSQNEIGLGRLFVQEAVKAGTWGLIFLLVMGMLITSVKQDIREAINYSVDRLAYGASNVATRPAFAGRVKTLVKKGVDYSLARAAVEAKGVIKEVKSGQ